MGDRVYATVHLGGHIETIKECQELENALTAEVAAYNLADFTEERIGCEEDARDALRYFIESKGVPEFFDEQCNYGVFECIEAAVSEVPGLGCCTTYEAGGGFPAGVKTVMPNGEEHGAEGKDGALVPIYDLEQARKADDPLAAIDGLIAEAKRAQGDELPPFTVSPAVAAYLKIFAQKVA